MPRNRRLTNNGKHPSPLFQMWTTLRFRIFLRAAAAAEKTTMSAFARTAIWEKTQRVLTEHQKARLERQASREENT